MKTVGIIIAVAAALVLGMQANGYIEQTKRLAKFEEDCKRKSGMFHKDFGGRGPTCTYTDSGGTLRYETPL